MEYTSGRKAKVLVVGLTCVDVVNYCDHYPAEDSDNTVSTQRIVKGGNAANTSCVLTQLDVEVDLLSTLSCMRHYQFVVDELRRFHVNLEYCPWHPKKFPSTSCIVNVQTGSRTLLHSPNDFPSLTFDEFLKVDVGAYDLIHFEGRGFPATGHMIMHALKNRLNGKPLVSGEMESSRRIKDLEACLLPHVDILFVGKDVAVFKGYSNPKDTVLGMSSEAVRAKYVICPWGDQGAAVAVQRSEGKRVHECPAYIPAKVVDTLGAGDTFIAASLAALLKGKAPQDIICSGCSVAGRKCGQFGFDGLGLKL